MYTADEVDDLLETWKLQGVSKPEQVRRLVVACLGWPYVFGAYGQMCTPQVRRNYAGYNPGYQEDIFKPCPALSGNKENIVFSQEDPGVILPQTRESDLCAYCKWDGARCFDCRGFTRWVLSQVGVNLYGGGATTQWETSSNWVARGEIKDLPSGLVCCLFKRKEGRMSHTGLYLGGSIIHCSGTVKEDALPGRPAWTHWAIPAGLYTTDELRKAGINVDDSRNIPTLRRGSVGDDVEELQALLDAKYGANLEIDGKFGKSTEAAVKAFQQAHGLTADGICGPKTWKALGISPGQLAEDIHVTSKQAENSQETTDERPADDQQTTPAGVWLTMEEWRTIKAAFAAAEAVIKSHD